MANVSGESATSTFTKLVAGISSDERELLLSKINSSKIDGLNLEIVTETVKEQKMLEVKYRGESFLYRFIVWLRALITKKTPQMVYNGDLISELGHRVNKAHPGLIDRKNALLLSLFCAKLKELKNAATFFKPYFSIVDEDPGKFYVFLSSLLTPEVNALIMQSCDPYNIPFDEPCSAAQKVALTKSMEETLKNMTSDTKGKLYLTIQSINWLKQFTEMPFSHFLSQFTSMSTSAYTCPFLNAQEDFEAFATILCNGKTLSKECVEALYLYPHKNNLMMDEKNDIDEGLRDYMLQFQSSFSIIQMFISTVPMKAIGKVLYEDYDWAPRDIGGSEDWFFKYKDEWKKVFNIRWNEYAHDRKKYELVGVLKKSFALDVFPQLPARPWTKIWGGIPFGCEMTAGFLWWFATNKYAGALEILNIVILEGVFINKDNRTQMSGAINEFMESCQQIKTLATSLGETGAVGSVFEKIIAERVRTLRGQQTISNLITNCENSVRNYGRIFCNSTREIDKIFNGILDDKKGIGYESLQNLMTIKGRDNKKFRDRCGAVRSLLNSARAVIAEIEPLDTEK